MSTAVELPKKTNGESPGSATELFNLGGFFRCKEIVSVASRFRYVQAFCELMANVARTAATVLPWQAPHHLMRAGTMSP